MARQGAAVVDVGGESTRPGAEPVSEREELRAGRACRRSPGRPCAGVGGHGEAGRGRSGRGGRGHPRQRRLGLAVAGGGRVGRGVGGHAHAGRAPHHAGRPPLRRRGSRGARFSVRPGPHRARGWGARGLGRPRHRLRQDDGAQPGPVAPPPRPRGRGRARCSWGPVARASWDAWRRAPGAARAQADRAAGSIATATWAMLAGAAMVRVHDVSSAIEAATLVGATRLVSGPARVGAR